MASAASSKSKSFTGQELSSLNQRYNAHVAYAGKVYDVSHFLERHPGGFDQLMLGAGRDITQLFRSYHKPGTAKLIGEKCKLVGELASNDMPTFPQWEGEFSTTLCARVYNYFQSNRLDPKVDVLTFFRYTAFCLLTLSSWYLCLTQSASWPLATLLAAASGFMCALVAMTVGHDGGHFAISHRPWIWRLSTTFGSSITGLSSVSWLHEHTYGHHVFTNIDGSDPDVQTNKTPDFWRIKHFQNWFLYYSFQHMYMPFLYLFLAIKLKIQDFHTLFIMKKGCIRLNPPTTYQSGGFFVEKVVHVMHRYIIPSFFVPLSFLIVMNLISDNMMGLWLGIVTQLNHINETADWPDPGSNGGDKQYKKSWVEMQIASTVDYATDSWFWTVVTGALNHQVAHHLFPGMLQTYYPAITPIVRETCKEFGITYYSLPSPWDAVSCHLRFLKVMGRAPNSKQ